MHCVLPAFLIVLLAPSLAMAEGKTVRDWTASCDESETCIAETTGSGGLAMGMQGYRLQAGRHAGENTAWFIRFIMNKVPKPKADTDIKVKIDGGEPFTFSQDYGYLANADGMTFGIGNTPDLDKFFAAFKKGNSLAHSFESDNGERHGETFSLSGRVATMDYGWVGTDQFVNYDFGSKSGWLHFFSKGRGIGDCGSSGTWVWNNDLFRMLEFRAWDDCDNGRMVDEWPVIFTYKKRKRESEHGRHHRHEDIREKCARSREARGGR